MGYLRNLTLRQIIVTVYCVSLAVTLTIAGFIAIKMFGDGMDERARDALDLNMRVAEGELAQARARSATVISDAAANTGLSRAVTDGAISSKVLRDLSAPEDFRVLAVVDRGGRVLAASSGKAGYASSWRLAATAGSASKAGSAMAIVPQADLAALGVVDQMRLEVKETPNGTIVEGEDDGALAVVAWAPVKGVPGRTLMGIRPLRLEYSVVDAITEKVGGVATIFQHGVRVATTVQTDEGKRAIGTVISDKVRGVTLDSGESYRGEAFVVNKQYLAAYEPIRDLDESVIGMLFIGLPPDAFTAAASSYARTYTLIVVFAILLNAAIAYYMSAALVAPLREVTAAAEVVATGDLTIEVPARGFREARVLGESFNTMITGLRRILRQVEESAGQLGSVAGEINSSSKTAADRAREQAASIAQTTAGVDELTRTFSAVADSAQRVMGISEDSLETAESGRETVDAAVGAMDALAGGSREVLTAAAALAESADTISGMTVLITSIAEQTKILALNAAIEAARAGDAGHGFSVVAAEVRSLAESVSESAGRISALVAEIQASSAALAHTAEQQAELTGGTLQQSMGTRDALDGIVAKMAETAAAAREIATASVEQRQAAQQILAVMNEVSSASSEAARAADEVTASASQVEGVSSDLFQGMSGFKTHG